jgi:hypothetical protein
MKKVLFAFDELAFSLACCGEENDLGSANFFLEIKVGSRASQSISGDLCFSSIGIEYTEFDATFCFIFHGYEKKTIGSHAYVPVADSSRKGAYVREILYLILVDDQEIVS